MPSCISNRRSWTPLGWTLAAVLAAVPLQAQAKTFHTDAVFSSSSGGPGPNNPVGGLAADAQGRLYGATFNGGSAGSGTIYRLTPGKLKSDPWTTEVLHSFTGVDGLNPDGGLYLDATGAVYGTTYYGGPTYGPGSLGHGVVFRLDNAPGWPMTILHSFGDVPDAQYPNSTLVLGKDGRFYGTSFNGGTASVGAVFAISPLGDSVSYEVIHSFAGLGNESFPSTLVVQGDGSIYVIAYYGGYGQQVFRLAEENDAWGEHSIYVPAAAAFLNSLLTGPHGALYLCSTSGSYGSAIQLSPPPSPGPWIENDLYAFGRDRGCESLTINPSGGFVGTSTSGGQRQSDGSLFTLTQSAPGGAYVARTFYRFRGSFEGPNANLLRLGGLYYGTSYQFDPGLFTVFDVRP